MANPNKARGTAWESAIRDYLNDRLGLYVDGWRELPGWATPFKDPADPLNIKRQAQEGSYDVGDAHAWPFILEAKDVKSPAVPSWLRQALVEARNAGFPYGVAVHKVRRANVARGRVHFDVRTWTRVRLALSLDTRTMRERYGFTPTLRGLDTGRWYVTCELEQYAQLLADVRRAQ